VEWFEIRKLQTLVLTWAYRCYF